jgi:hypothetical protein
MTTSLSELVRNDAALISQNMSGGFSGYGSPLRWGTSQCLP